MEGSSLWRRGYIGKPLLQFGDAQQGRLQRHAQHLGNGLSLDRERWRLGGAVDALAVTDNLDGFVVVAARLAIGEANQDFVG